MSTEDDESIIELLPDEEAVPSVTDVPNYLLLQDTARIAEARRCWALQQLVSADGVLPASWREDWKDIVRGLKEGPEHLKSPRAKPQFGVLKGDSNAQS